MSKNTKESNRRHTRKFRHGNWRQTFIDCGGMCVARHDKDSLPCGERDFLEFHETWGENHDKDKTKFTKRILLCNYHHSLIDGHNKELIKFQFKLSMLQQDINQEIESSGGYRGWVKRFQLDDSRFACLCFEGAIVPQSEEEIEYSDNH